MTTSVPREALHNRLPKADLHINESLDPVLQEILSSV